MLEKEPSVSQSEQEQRFAFTTQLLWGITPYPKTEDSIEYQESVAIWANTISDTINIAHMSKEVKQSLLYVFRNAVLQHKMSYYDNPRRNRLEKACSFAIAESLVDIFGKDRISEFRRLRREEKLLSYDNSKEIEELNLSGDEIAVAEILEIIETEDESLMIDQGKM